MRRSAVLLAATALTFVGAPSFAQSPTAAEIAEIRAQIITLTTRLEQLERQVQQAPNAASAARSAEVTSAIPEGAVTVPVATPGPRNVSAPLQLASAPIDRPLQSPGSVVEISASSGSGEVAFQMTSGGSNPDLRGRPGGWASSWNWTFTAKAPLDKDADRTDLARFDALTSGLELSLQWSNYRRWISDPRTNRQALALEAEARANCARTAPESAKAACATAGVSGSFIAAHIDDDAERRWLGFLFGSAHAYGLEGSVGYQNHRFIDAALLTRDEEAHVPWGVRAYYAYLPRNTLTSWTFAAEYQDAVEDGDSGVLCPVSAVSPVVCLSGPIGAPASNDRLLTSVEWRSQFEFDRPLFNRIGVSAQFAYDHESDEFGIDIPIYLVANDDGGLIGGIRFGYGSKEDEMAAGVFISAPFSLR